MPADAAPAVLSASVLLEGQESHQLHVAQVYAQSIMFGYFIRRVDERFQLEKSLGSLVDQASVDRLERLFSAADQIQEGADPDAPSSSGSSGDSSRTGESLHVCSVQCLPAEGYYIQRELGSPLHLQSLIEKPERISNAITTYACTAFQKDAAEPKPPLKLYLCMFIVCFRKNASLGSC